MKNKWYKRWLGVILLLIFFFPVGLYQMWKNTNWNRKIKWGITTYFILATLGFILIANAEPVAVSSQQKELNTPNNSVQPTTVTPTKIPTATIVFTPTNTAKPTVQSKAPTKTPTPTKAPEPTKKPVIASKKITDKINNLVAEKYPDFEVTIWNKNSDFASEGQVPYEIVLNGSFSKTASSCDAAKKTAYYMLETFYKDNEIRPTLSRVMITFPYYLRVSLGASDGVPMAEDGSFSGPTNFWTVMENMGLGENESGEMKNRTWGTYLTKCE